MVKKMMTAYNWKSWWRCFHKNSHLVTKLGVTILLIALLAFTLLYSRSSNISDSPFLENADQVPAASSVTFQESTDQVSSLQENGGKSTNSDGKCNLFVGDWVPYKQEPFYTNRSCSFIEDHQNCMKNGRPDTGYLYWRWNPRGCELPRPDLKRFLESVRDKTWAFIGDSISRNHAQSFLCVLSSVAEANEVYHDEDYKSRRWFIPSYNFTVSILWSPFLAKAVFVDDINGIITSDIELHLDVLDKNWTNPYKSFDYMVFSSGKWFLRSAVYYEKNSILGCHYCKRNLTELGFNFAYRKVMRNLFKYITDSTHKGMIFYRTTTPDHFAGGQWFEGGTCRRQVPAKEGEFELNELNKILRDIELEEFEKASVKASENGVNLKLFDMSPLSLLRPDGHPGPYRFFQPFAKDKNAKVINDCLHWCLPGPIDSWNDILVEMVANG